MNSAVQYALEHAIVGVSPNFTLDYSKVVLSRGSLTKMQNIVLTSLIPNELEITWETKDLSSASSTSDRLVIFGFTANEWSFLELTGPVNRGALSYTLSLPSEFSGNLTHLWFSFVSEDGKKVSWSEHRSITLV